MHFITGGHFNGKAQWVKEQQKYENAYWITFYNRNSKMAEPEKLQESCIVINGVEAGLYQHLNEHPSHTGQTFMDTIISYYLIWEKAEKNRSLIIIGTDITKGIVPAEPMQRRWRDETGWLYQSLLKKAEDADLIWFGINQPLKRRKLI
ncbi:bifunctional adenosylcobinamide kinase/adenosylcobinamide-phosphate guanylyltransferase [Alteribacillus sp. HJP-4]|uniref:bifunctional adenosylcobinamide kinase/adenosylcobinamide-phosphate guanylyltransferase n=1 Tax=Alteribacillus sp. HJP-4 TaxID=2775394 RepID=UPI0035CCEAA3